MRNTPMRLNKKATEPVAPMFPSFLPEQRGYHVAKDLMWVLLNSRDFMLVH